MPRLIVLVLSGLLLAALPGCTETAPPEEPRTPARPAGKLQSLAAYAQELQAVYEQGLEISAEMDEAEVQIGRYVDGELPGPDMRRQVENVRRRARGAIGDYESLLDTLPPRPQFGNPQHDSSMQASEDMVHGFKEDLEAQWLLLGRLMDTALGDDETAYELASADSLALMGTMIDAENIVAEAALLGAEQDHPQRGVYHSWIGSNRAARAALMLVEDLLRGRALRASEARSEVERGLERAENGIESGRRDVGAMRARFDGRPAVTDADRIARRFIRDMMRSYDRSFDDEARIVAAMRDFLDALISTVEAPETQARTQLAAAAERFQVEIDGLVESRLREQETRLRMIEEFSAAMAELQ